MWTRIVCVGLVIGGLLLASSSPSRAEAVPELGGLGALPAAPDCVVPEPGPFPTPAPLPPQPFATPPAVAAAPAGSAGQSSSNVFVFPITRHRVSGLWLDYVKSHGDLDNLGLPRSEVICDPLTGQIVQYFQRVVLEYHPEASLSYRIERRLLVDDLYPDAPEPPANGELPPGPGAYYFPIGPRGFGHFIADVAPDGSATTFKRYFDTHGREDTFGYPKEEPKLRNGLWTQRFQAAVFEYHPQLVQPLDGVAGPPFRGVGVQLELLGDEYIAKYNLGLR